MKTAMKHLIILSVISCVVFSNTFLNEWTYDDLPVVVKNPDSHSLSGFTANSRPGRPLRELTYIADYALFGTNPAGYHIQQLAWHTGCGILIWLIIATMTGSEIAASAGALLFLLHPLQSESVANISHRKELLALFFILVSFLVYLRAITEKLQSKKILLGVVVIISYCVALTANQTAAPFPLILFAYDFLAIEQRNRFILRFPGVTVPAFFIVITLGMYHYRGVLFHDNLLAIYSKHDFVATKSYIPFWMGSLKAYAFYIYKIILPINLAPEYHIPFSINLFQPWALFGGMLLICTLLLIVRLRSNAPLASFGLAWFMIMYLPVSNILPLGYMVADRYMYLCLPGISIAFAWYFNRYSSQLAMRAAYALIATLALLTVIQNSYWKDEHTLWRHAVIVNPDSTWVQETVALSFQIKGDFKKAREHASIALKLNRFNTRAYLTLAKAEDRLGNLHEALVNYQRFVQYGYMEYPQETRNVANYIPLLQKRIFILQEAPVTPG